VSAAAAAWTREGGKRERRERERPCNLVLLRNRRKIFSTCLIVLLSLLSTGGLHPLKHATMTQMSKFYCQDNFNVSSAAAMVEKTMISLEGFLSPSLSSLMWAASPPICMRGLRIEKESALSERREELSLPVIQSSPAPASPARILHSCGSTVWRIKTKRLFACNEYESLKKESPEIPFNLR